MSDEPKPKQMNYAEVGVDTLSGDHVQERIAYLAQKTFNRNVLSETSSFGTLFRLDLQRWKNPILVSSGQRGGSQAESGL